MAEEGDAPVVTEEPAVPEPTCDPIAPYDSIETTFAIIKPDAREKAPEIIVKIQEAGFTVAHTKVLHMTPEQARQFYAEHHGKNFFNKLIDFMSSGECIVMALCKDNAVMDWRKLIGPTNSVVAKEKDPDSLRGLFGTDNTMNAVHGSSSLAAAMVELSFFFPKHFVYQRSVAFALPGLPATAYEGIEARFSAWGFNTMEKSTITLDEARARVLAENWAVERPYEMDPAEDDGSFLLPYLLRAHDPALDQPPVVAKVLEEGEEAPPEPEEGDEAVEKTADPVCPPTEAMNVEKMVAVLTSGEVTVYLLGRYGAIHALQCLTGPQEPAVARFNAATGGTLRAFYGATRENCALHASSGADSARKEVKLFFPAHCEEQLTLAIIKPDAVAAGHAPLIRQLIKLNGFKINDEFTIHQTGASVEEFYAEHIEKEFFPQLKTFMTGGNCIALALSRVGAIAMWRALIGPTNSETAKAQQPRSLRGLFGTDGTMNACHGSDAPESGAREIALLLPDYFNHQSTLAVLKPDLTGPARQKVLKCIRDEGFFVQDEKRVSLSLDEAKSFCALPDVCTDADAKASATHLASGPCVVLTLSRPNAVRYWMRLMGPKNATTARETEPLSLRGSCAAGSDAVKNACHGSESVEGAAREVRFFFPRMVRSSKPAPGLPTAARYVEVELQPTLTKALTQLCKVKPPDPLQWLSAWLLDNNPNKPRVQLPPKPEKRPRMGKVPAKTADDSAKEIVFLMSPTAGTTLDNTPVAQAKMLETEFGFGHIGMSKLVEEEVQAGTEMGKQLARCKQADEDLPYETLIALMKRFIALSNAKSFVVTDFPANMDHVRGYEKLMPGVPTVVSMEPNGGVNALRELVDSAGEKKLHEFENSTSQCAMYYTKKKMLTKVAVGIEDTAATVFKNQIRKIFFSSKPKHFLYLLGPDAVGRAAVGAAIADKYEFRHINLGGLMTDELISKTPAGLKINALLKGKRRIPTDIVVDLIKNAVMKDSEKNFVIDGFPLSVDELAALEKAIGVSCDAAVHLKCDKEIIDARIAADTGENASAARTIEDARGAGSALADGVVEFLREEGKLIEVEAGQNGMDVLADIEAGVLMANFKERSKKVFVLGGPGAGKGTQCQVLVEQFGFVHLSAGDLLRAEVRSGSPHGSMISNMIRQGKIVPAEITVGLLQQAMDKSMATRFLIDGFPRDMGNVIAWEKILGNPEFVLAFDCPEEELNRRLLKRGETSNRSDDNAATIKKRFKTFVDQSMPVLDYYDKKGLVRKVSAVGSVPQVTERTLKHFHMFKKVPDIIFVLGGPGSGKGTQCTRISNEYGFVHLSAGDLLRAEIQAGSKDGALIAGMIREGKIVPQEITIRLLRNAMDARPGCRFLIDGYPRALGQAMAFEEMIGHAKMVVFFDASDETLTERLLSGRTSGPIDDNAEAITKRLMTYHSQSQPVITAYEAKGLVKKVNAMQTPDQVFADVETALGAFRKQQIMYVLGQPLSGKTSLCKSLARTGVFSHVAFADLLRSETMLGTDFGKQIADHVRVGKPVPQEIIIALIKRFVEADEKGKCLIDGFPRSVAEASALAEAIGQPHTVMYLDCAEQGFDVTVARNAADPAGGDAAAVEEKLRIRFDKFEAESLGLVADYEKAGVLKRIEAVQNDEDGAPMKAVAGTKIVYEQAAPIFGL